MRYGIFGQKEKDNDHIFTQAKKKILPFCCGSIFEENFGAQTIIQKLEIPSSISFSFFLLLSSLFFCPSILFCWRLIVTIQMLPFDAFKLNQHQHHHHQSIVVFIWITSLFVHNIFYKCPNSIQFHKKITWIPRKCFFFVCVCDKSLII